MDFIFKGTITDNTVPVNFSINETSSNSQSTNLVKTKVSSTLIFMCQSKKQAF